MHISTRICDDRMRVVAVFGANGRITILRRCATCRRYTHRLYEPTVTSARRLQDTLDLLREQNGIRYLTLTPHRWQVGV